MRFYHSLLYILILVQTFVTVQSSFFDFKISNISKIIVIADVHADIFRFKYILRDANVLDTNDRWIAQPGTVIVQLGDQIDPKEPDANDIDDKHHFKMIYFTYNLQKLAVSNQCHFLSMVGNHELYNIDKIRKKEFLREIIATRPILLHLDNYLFCHGGFKKRHYYILDMYNKTIDDIYDIWYKYVYNLPLTINDGIILKYLILDVNDSILFTRTHDKKEDIDKLFNVLGIDYMFVGHMSTEYITVKNKIWSLDMYLKDTFDKMTYSYIVIENENIYVKQLENYPDDPLYLINV